MKMFMILVALIFGLITNTEAGLFDAFGNIMQNDKIEEPLKAFNPMYQVNHNKEALDAGFNGNIDRSYGRNSLWDQQRPVVTGFPQIFPSMETTTINPTIAKNIPNGVKLLSRLKEINILKDEGNQNPTETKSSTDLGPDIATYFPTGVKLLNTVKDLNRLKDESKLLGSNENNNKEVDHDLNYNFGMKNVDNPKNGNLNNSFNGKFNNDTGKKPNTMSNEKIYNKYNEKLTNNSNNKDDTESNGRIVKNTNEIKTITVQKFYYQAQPVIPENERKEHNEVIYYSG